MGAVYSSSALISIRNDQGTEMKKIIDTRTTIPNSQVPELVINVHDIAASAPRRFASHHLLDDNEEAREKYLSMCVPLYNAVLGGDWGAAERIIAKDKDLLTTSISTGGLTAIHLASGTDRVHFVEQLVAMMRPEDLELCDEKGNTALCFAAMGGTVQIARILLRKNPSLATKRGGQEMTALYMAAMFGKSDMAWYLYDKIEESCNDEDRKGIFFSCIDSAIYDLALEMVKKDVKLATARDKNNKTALHLLAQTPEAFAEGGSRGWLKSCLKLKLKSKLKGNSALDLVKCVWKQVISLGHDKAMDLIRTPELLFDATKKGNFEFIHELVKSYPDLAWEYDSENRTIIHFAVMYRHANIFNIIHDIGPIKEVIATYDDSEKNHLLHLAAKLPPNLERLNTVSGPALQMQQELLWFQAVKRIMQPLYVKRQNAKQEIPEQLFSQEHKILQGEGETWMKNTAHSGMLVATLIATVVFAAAFTLPGGNNNEGVPNYRKNASFMSFVLSDGLAFVSSIVSIMMFLSILTSRYAESDFQKSLPLKLMIGLASLFFSIMTMVIAFASTIAIACHDGLKWVPFLISIFAFVPIALFVFLQFPLFYDTFSSTYWSRTMFKPSQRMLYYKNKLC